MSPNELEWALKQSCAGGALMNEWPVEDSVAVWLADSIWMFLERATPVQVAGIEVARRVNQGPTFSGEPLGLVGAPVACVRQEADTANGRRTGQTDLQDACGPPHKHDDSSWSGWRCEGEKIAHWTAGVTERAGELIG